MCYTAAPFLKRNKGIQQLRHVFNYFLIGFDIRQDILLLLLVRYKLLIFQFDRVWEVTSAAGYVCAMQRN